MGHNVATFTRPNCFGWYFFRLKQFSEIGLAVFPEAKLFSTPIFRVKNEIQNWIPEFASRYGMPAGDHCGDATEMIGNGIGKGRRKGWLALASCDRNEVTACAQDQREANSNEPNKKGAPKGALAWLGYFMLSA